MRLLFLCSLKHITHTHTHKHTHKHTYTHTHTHLYRTAPLLEMIKHAAALLPDKSAYQQARNAGRTHGYAVKEGLLLAPGGQTDVAALVAGAGADKLIRV